MVKLAAVVLLAGTFLVTGCCCWPVQGGGRYRYYGQTRYEQTSPAPHAQDFGRRVADGR